jgi:hypothetical protein
MENVMRSIRSRFAGSYTSLFICLPLAGVIAAGTHNARAVDAAASGVTIRVTNCNDSGPGSLRAAVAAALSDDTVDLRTLGCSRIKLTSGAIESFRKNLTLLGPGYARLTIDGNGTSSVLRHHPPAPTPDQTQADGRLRIVGMSIANGRLVESFARGGCIFSRGDIVLVNAQVRHCLAKDPFAGGGSSGGAIYAGRDVSLLHSAVFASSALDITARSGGGGIWSFGHLTLDHSQVCNNYSAGDAGGAASGALTVKSSTIHDNTAVGVVGGLLSFGTGSEGDARIDKSTIYNNRADIAGGAGLGAGDHVLITQSTFSGNHSARNASALIIDGRSPTKLSIRNSTFTRNVSDADFYGDRIGAIELAGVLHIHSTILAGNTCSGLPQDIWGRAKFGDRIQGDNNLINVSALSLPADTISADPRVAALANNGGPTKTHALLADSPAIDRGNNQLGFIYDQRGPKFLRVKGPGPDIGAYER